MSKEDLGKSQKEAPEQGEPQRFFIPFLFPFQPTVCTSN
jgi:hypothetical protein